ncbi:aminodeoxychorismate lyase [Denitrovibrio acetiphilus DSM 12809]|uniref:Endolytic murein transglycosylase n=1 Tax=Denitrovibrio acetiphilus (strain DSM 12809 / NBRC 114555 / N2460) TaxID=522772 RepID=D4H8I5_DENA2|nr:endolytic transglycosylase MltG [Denitrovibrio acetiphilus]ADD68334.1 aminodeoxychorismate lyase [Denitrovibrio acetiphilus DSM 12809]
MYKIFGLAVILAAFLLTSIAGYWIIQCEKFLDNTIVTVELNIEQNETFNGLYKRLFAHLDTPPFFRLYLIKKVKLDRNIKYGYYRADKLPVRRIVDAIMKGRQSTIKVTIPEGYNMYDVANRMSERIVESPGEFLKTVKDKTYIKNLTGMGYQTLEGFLYPDTYFFSPKSEPQYVISAMYQAFLKSLPEHFDEKAEKLGLTRYQAVILASIIQKETYDPLEAPLIASVFHNRMKYRMRLQADPTIIYGLYPEFDGNIRKTDLRDRSNPYNTYKINGLPPTPICSPSIVALEAAVNPADTKYLYFVADKERKHIFSTNYDEHMRQVYYHQKLNR